MRIANALLDLLFPPKCPFCGRVQDAPDVCPACEETLPWTDEDQGLRRLRGGLLCAAPLWYEDAVRDAIRRFKFRGGVTAAGPLGEQIAQVAAERFSGGFDTVAWVPVSARRLRQRGYDQSLLLAEGACKLWGVEPERLLRKIRDNPAQSGLERAEDRWKNTQDVYVAAGDPAGRRILLVDDVCSTGSTLVSAAGVLLEAGAAEVVCVVAAFPRPEAENGGEKGKE